MKNYLRGLKKLNGLMSVSPDKCVEVKLDMEQVFLCQLTLPMMPKKEVNEAVRWELPLHVPYTEESYYYDYKLVASRDGMQIVQAVVTTREVIDKLEAEAKSKALILTGAFVEVEGELYNLVPNASKRKRLPLTRLYNLGTILALSLGAVLLIGGYCYKTIQAVELENVAAQITDMQIWKQRYEEQAVRRKKLKALKQAVSKLDKERLPWGEVLPILERSTPRNCWLTNIRQKDAARDIEFSGKAVDVKQVQSLINNLQLVREFTAVKLLETYALKDELVGYRVLLKGSWEVK